MKVVLVSGGVISGVGKGEFLATHIPCCRCRRELRFVTIPPPNPLSHVRDFLYQLTDLSH